MRAAILLALLAACTPTPQQREQAAADRKAVLMTYAADLQMTPVAYVCHGVESGPRKWDRCDLRTKEGGVLPLVCTPSMCRLLD